MCTQTHTHTHRLGGHHQLWDPAHPLGSIVPLVCLLKCADDVDTRFPGGSFCGVNDRGQSPIGQGFMDICILAWAPEKVWAAPCYRPQVKCPFPGRRGLMLLGTAVHTRSLNSFLWGCFIVLNGSRIYWCVIYILRALTQQFLQNDQYEYPWPTIEEHSMCAFLVQHTRNRNTSIFFIYYFSCLFLSAGTREVSKKVNYTN